jgi:LSD1 subclass zinc finger protein
MPRPKKDKIVGSPPLFSCFKPVGVRRCLLRDTKLELDEYEAIRLSDYEGLDHVRAAARMGISRSTFSRLVETARKKVARFLVDGEVLQIAGGRIHFRDNILKCSECGKMFGVPIGASVVKCPVCGSSELVNLAGSYGHGMCCLGVTEKEGPEKPFEK